MRIVTSVLVLASVACAIPTPNEESGESGPNPHYGGYYGGYYGYRPYYGYGYGYWGRKKRSTDEAVAAVPEDIEEVNVAPRDEAPESGPHYGGYYGYRGYYGYPYYGGYWGWGRKKRSVEDNNDDISEGEIEGGPHGYYGWGGYGWGGYRGYYGYPYYRGYYGWGRKKRSTDETVAALPEDIEEVNVAPRDEAPESGPHGYYGWGGYGGYGYGGYRGYYGYPYYRGYGGWWGRKKRSAEETVGDDISEPEDGSGPDPHYGYYYGGYRPYWGYRGYGYGGYWGGYGHGYWG